MVVVVEEGADGGGVVCAVGGGFEVDGEVDPVEVAVQKKRLVCVEGEASQDVAELRPLRAFLDASDPLSDPASDALVGFCGGTGSEDGIEGEDAAWGLFYFLRKDSLEAAEE